MSLGLFIAVAAVVLGVLGLLGVVGATILAISLIVAGVVWAVADRPWVRR